MSGTGPRRHVTGEDYDLSQQVGRTPSQELAETEADGHWVRIRIKSVLTDCHD